MTAYFAFTTVKSTTIAIDTLEISVDTYEVTIDQYESLPIVNLSKEDSPQQKNGMPTRVQMSSKVTSGMGYFLTETMVTMDIAILSVQ